jgi:hypothetical protein
VPCSEREESITCSFRGEGNKIGRGRKNFRGRGVDITKARDMIFTMTIAEGMGHTKQRTAKSHGRRSNADKIRKKTKIKHQI